MLPVRCLSYYIYCVVGTNIFKLYIAMSLLWHFADYLTLTVFSTFCYISHYSTGSTQSC